MLLKQFCSCSKPERVLMYSPGQSLRKPRVLPWSPCSPRQWRKGSYCCPLCPDKDKDTAELVCSQKKTGPGERLAEFTGTTELRGMQRLKKKFRPLLCPRSSCVTCPLFCRDFPVPVHLILTFEKDLAWMKEGTEESN